MADSATGELREIEFEASGAETALQMTHQLCGDRTVQLFEDGRMLANLQISPKSGFWYVS